MTTLERINQRAAEVDVRKVVLLALMALPYALGWIARKTVLGLMWATAWLWAAAVEGWTNAGGKRDEDTQPWATR